MLSQTLHEYGDMCDGGEIYVFTNPICTGGICHSVNF